MSKTKKAQRSKEELLRIAQVDERILPTMPEPPEIGRAHV